MHLSLEKQLERYQKIDDLKQHKEKEIEEYRNTAIKAMIERERIQETLLKSQ